MNKEELLAMRKKKNAKKPSFIRQDTNKKKRLKNNAVWRKPKGRHSKTRLCKKGHEKMPTTGWGSPKAVKFLHKSGLKQILICNLKDLDAVKKEEEGIIVSGVLGTKKKLELIKKAEEKGIKILNIKDTKVFVENVQKEKEEKKKKREAKLTKRTKKKAAKPKVEKKEEIKKETDEEDKKKEEKKEKDKVLIKKS